MSRYFMHAVIAAIVLIAAFGWIGVALEFDTVVIITITLVAIAVLAIVGVALIGRIEKRDHDRR